MGTFREILVRPFLVTGTADLAGLVGVHEHDGTPGACSLGDYHAHKLSPPSIMDRLIEATFSGSPIGQVRARRLILLRPGTPDHVLFLQSLKGDTLVLIDELARCLVFLSASLTVGRYVVALAGGIRVLEVGSLVTYLAVTGRNTPDRLLASFAATLFTGKTLLSLGELLFCLSIVA
jgi:hypothetical protein